MVGTETIRVEVAYALPGEQRIIELEVPVGTTAFEAVRQSGIERQFAGLDVTSSDMGVFGKAIKAHEYALKAGDRVEIYRPLQADPKAVRKKRAARAKTKAKTTG